MTGEQCLDECGASPLLDGQEFGGRLPVRLRQQQGVLVGQPPQPARHVQQRLRGVRAVVTAGMGD
ncbi:hypothetical protein ACIHFC_13720 [Streptomyces sp. NPDC052013]|uniref:hypothetical protein n=1 Tax=Streptomyces sp. NPDC052013 TaxID=3365679 RepID=UPI0037D12AD2